MDRDVLAQALQAATKAVGYDIDGNVIRLTFAEGSVEDVSAMINCSAAGQVITGDDRVVLVYPDGEKDCAADGAADSSADSADEPQVATVSATAAGTVAAPDASATARLTLGDRTWEFPAVACAFGEQEIGVAGAEFNMLATGDGLMLYAAIDDGYTYIEFAATGEDSDDAIELITNPEPTISIDGNTISGQGTFVGNGDAGPGEPIEGTIAATCP